MASENPQFQPGTGPPVAQPVAPVAQPVYFQPPSPAQVNAAGVAQPEAPVLREEQKHQLEERTPDVILYSHSSLYYWWPLWAVGFILALVTYLQGQAVTIGHFTEIFHPSSSLGVIYFLTLFLVILITNVTVRGTSSALVIVSVMFVTLLFAYMGWWDPILMWAGNLSIHMNLGAYLFFSTLMFLVWTSTVFVFDRLTYWRIKAGQITHEFVYGAGSTSYATEGMVLEKHRDDFFRHWLLGLGSGDLRIHTMGAQRDQLDIPNVLFIGTKIDAIQRLIAEKPDEFGRATLK